MTTADAVPSPSPSPSPSPRSKLRAALLTWVPVAAAGVLLVVHALRFNFVTDDAYISFVYSRNLARSGSLVFNLGEHVEGYTNFLWTVLLAAVYKVGLSLEVASRVLGVLASLATLWVTVLIGQRVSGRRSLAHGIAPLLLAGWGGFACWTISGLETALFTLLVVAAAYRLLCELTAPAPPAGGRVRRLWAANGSALLLALAALTRPEGLVFIAIAAAARLAYLRRRPQRADLWWLATVLALLVPHLLWRRAYYGWWLPNTFYVKAAGGPGVTAQGWSYLRWFLQDSNAWIGVVLLPIALVAVSRAGVLFFALAAAWIGFYFLYVVKVGGDFMGMFRFLMPVFPFLALAAQEGLAAIGRALARTRLTLAGVALTGAALAALHTGTMVRETRKGFAWVRYPGIDTPGRLRAATERWSTLGKWFHTHLRRDDLMSVGPAGAMIWFGDLRALDCHGLADEYIAHRVPATSIRPGHQKWCPEDYLFRRRPTVMNNGWTKRPGPDTISRFAAQGYYYVVLRIPGHPGPLALAIELTSAGAPRLDVDTVRARTLERMQLAPGDIAEIWL